MSPQRVKKQKTKRICFPTTLSSKCSLKLCIKLDKKERKAPPYDENN
jgi:hypothetical protein